MPGMGAGEIDHLGRGVRLGVDFKPYRPPRAFRFLLFNPTDP